jgi:hypothetical protein
MSRVSKLQYVNKDFNVKNRYETNKKICILAFRDGVSALKKGEISDKVKLTFVKKNIRLEYPDFNEEQCELGRQSVGEWFKRNKYLPELNSFRSRFPRLFSEDEPFQQAEILFDTVETVSEQPQAPEEVETVRHYQQMGAKHIETPTGFKIQF